MTISLSYCSKQISMNLSYEYVLVISKDSLIWFPVGFFFPNILGLIGIMRGYGHCSSLKIIIVWV